MKKRYIIHTTGNTWVKVGNGQTDMHAYHNTALRPRYGSAVL